MESNSSEEKQPSLTESEGQKQQMIDRFRQLHEKLVKLVDNFPPDRRRKVLFDKWSLREVLIHIAAWNRRDAYGFQATKRDEGQINTFIEDEDLDKFNEEAVDKAKDRSWDDVYRDFVDSGQELIEAAQQLPEPEWSTTIDPKGEITLKDDFAYSIGHYQNEHIPQLKKLADTV